jgi:acyl-CoA thioester hydrolase
MVYPTIEQLRELPVQLSMAIPPEWEDRNGHVNVQFYLALYELGGWVVLEEIGVDENWFSRHRVSQFDLEHHLNYRAELKVGDQVTTYSRVLGRSEKRFHGMYFIVNETKGRLAATLEYITASVDMNTRRAAPFREELSNGLDRLIEKHRALGWTAPVIGTMNP